MRSLFSFLLFLLLAFVIGALLAPPLFHLLAQYSDIEFHKVVSRLISLCGLGLVCVWLCHEKIFNPEAAGYHHTRLSLPRDLLTGIAAGIFIMLVLEALLVVLGIHGPEPDMQLTLAFILPMLIKAIIAGLAVGALEETLYRGALFGGLMKKMNLAAAALISSLIYSAVHFIKFPAWPPDMPVMWYSGLQLLPDSFDRFGNPVFLDMFLALTAFGMLLALLRIRKGNIIQAIGLHAGVVMTIKIIRDVTDYAPGNGYDFLVNRFDHLLGYLAFVWLLVLTVVYFRFVLRRTPRHK